MNSNHIGFTFFNLREHKDFHDLTTKLNRAGFCTPLKIALVFFSFFTMGLFLFGVLSGPPLLVCLFTVLIIFFGTQHPVFQSYGLTQMRHFQTQAGTLQSPNSVRLRRNLCWGLVIAMTLIQLSPFMNYTFLTDDYYKLAKVCAGVALVLVAILLRPWLFGRNSIRDRAFIFYLRFLLIPLSAFSLAANVGFYAIHGSESFALQNRIMKKSSLEKPERWRLGLLCFLYFAGCTAIYFFTPRWSGFHPHVFAHGLLHKAVIGFGCVTTGITLTHYYIEREWFKLSRPINRAAILHLFG
jgi:hypothetical protein